MSTPQNQTKLSSAEYAAAQTIFGKMNQPLTADELSMCVKLGMTPEAFKESRDHDLAAQLPGGAAGLDASERQVCKLLNMSEQDYAAEKRRAAGG